MSPRILNPQALAGWKPQPERAATFHESQVAYHDNLTRVCLDLADDEAAAAHHEAARRHEAAALNPSDAKLRREAMLLSGLADQASQRAGVKPSTGGC